MTCDQCGSNAAKFIDGGLVECLSCMKRYRFDDPHEWTSIEKPTAGAASSFNYPGDLYPPGYFPPLGAAAEVEALLKRCGVPNWRRGDTGKAKR